MTRFIPASEPIIPYSERKLDCPRPPASDPDEAPLPHEIEPRQVYGNKKVQRR